MSEGDDGGVPPIVPIWEGTPNWVKWFAVFFFLAVSGGLLQFCHIPASDIPASDIPAPLAECLAMVSRLDLDQLDRYDQADVERALVVSLDFIDAGCPELVGLHERWAGCQMILIDGYLTDRDGLRDFYDAGCGDVPPWNTP